jgi:AAA+ ATPase superfamily predicted ATPase
MGNQNVKIGQQKVRSDCKILIIGGKSSGKTTLFHKIISEFTKNSPHQFNNYISEQFLSQIFHITLKVAKACNIKDFKKKKRFKTFLELEKKVDGNLQKFKKEICSIWEEKVMIEKLESKEGFQYIKKDE